MLVLSDNPERRAQLHAQLLPRFPEWDQLDGMARSDSVLSAFPPQPPRTPPASGTSPVERLREAGVRVEPGLSDAEIASVQARYRFVFAEPHRLMLQDGLPVDTVPGQRSWPDWRHGDPRVIEQWIERTPERHPVTGRSVEPAPPLIPLRGNRFYPSGPGRSVGPVFSFGDTVDILYWAPTLSGWLDVDFDGSQWTVFRLPDGSEVPYWSNIVERDDERLGAQLWATTGGPVVADLTER